MRRRLPSALAALAAAALATAALAGAAEDSDVARKVGEQLRRSPLIGQFALTAKARDGRVTLDGRVHTLSESWDAEDLAGKVRGVLEIDNRIAIDSRGTSDAAIEAAIKRRYEDIVAVATAAPEVRVVQGAVTLSGKLRDGRTRFTAIDAAAKIPGVVAVEDRFETPAKDDETIGKEVAGVLANLSLLGVSGKVRPTVKDGIVTLTGRVGKLYDRKRLTRLALGANGVRGVENRLEIGSSKSDLLIPLE